MKNLYSPRAEERRKQFNTIINSVNMVLMNNIPEVDPSIWDNWTDKSPMTPEPCEFNDSAGDKMLCSVHDGEVIMTSEDWDEDWDEDSDMVCDNAESDQEVFQWFALGQNDAKFLARHGQYITYSDLLDTHFLAITHFGTSWDYVDSMVSAFDNLYTNLESFNDKESN